MNYEEKYKSALKWMQSLYGGLHGATKEEAEKYFPELKVSEDERIRKELIDFLKLPHSRFVGNREHEKWIAWLEKQGKQDARYEDIEKLLEADTIYQMAMNDAMVEEAKSKAINALSELAISKILGLEKQCERNFDYEHADIPQKDFAPIEPKFKVGEWVVYDHIPYQVVELPKEGYINLGLRRNGKVEFAPSPYCRHWTIQDARDGDLIYVSTEEKGIQAIFHEYKNDTIFFHCYLCTDFVQGGCMPIGSVELTYPLQKTHYNRFFEKMHEAGYEWDNEKKELRKIESKTLDADKVIEWMNHRELSCDDVVNTVIPDDSPTSFLHKVKLLSD